MTFEIRYPKLAKLSEKVVCRFHDHICPDAVVFCPEGKNDCNEPCDWSISEAKRRHES